MYKLAIVPSNTPSPFPPQRKLIFKGGAYQSISNEKTTGKKKQRDVLDYYYSVEVKKKKENFFPSRKFHYSEGRRGKRDEMGENANFFMK